MQRLLDVRERLVQADIGEPINALFQFLKGK